MSTLPSAIAKVALVPVLIVLALGLRPGAFRVCHLFNTEEFGCRNVGEFRISQTFWFLLFGATRFLFELAQVNPCCDFGRQTG